MLLESIAIVLAVARFSIPIAYYWYLKTMWLNKPLNIDADPSYTPMALVIVPTYNETWFIDAKLSNIYGQDYPRDRLEIVVVDSASSDGTPKKVLE